MRLFAPMLPLGLSEYATKGKRLGLNACKKKKEIVAGVREQADTLASYTSGEARHANRNGKSLSWPLKFHLCMTWAQHDCCFKSFPAYKRNAL